MVYPTKKDIEEALTSLDIHVNACKAVTAMLHSKRIGAMIDAAQSMRHISKDEDTDYHNKSNQIIRKFDNKCSCSFK